ncbi:hypothetical protein [Filifactor alocis]|uniref:hypothetical protein n=1 Tax=Filifactor alocis TaxID=143361 RepID=UPI0028E64092|nr:hypothetical protein [Filifactor alocis]
MKKRKGVLLLELMASIFICIMMSFTVIKILNINQQFDKSMHQHRNHKDKLDKQLYADENVSLEDIKKDIKHMELRTGSFSIPVKVIEVDYSDRDNTEKLFFVESVEVP